MIRKAVESLKIAIINPVQLYKKLPNHSKIVIA